MHTQILKLHVNLRESGITLPNKCGKTVPLLRWAEAASPATFCPASKQVSLSGVCFVLCHFCVRNMPSTDLQDPFW